MLIFWTVSLRRHLISTSSNFAILFNVRKSVIITNCIIINANLVRILETKEFFCKNLIHDLISPNHEPPSEIIIFSYEATATYQRID